MTKKKLHIVISIALIAVLAIVYFYSCNCKVCHKPYNYSYKSNIDGGGGDSGGTCLAHPLSEKH